MIFLERIKTELIMAVGLKDELSPDQCPIGDVFLTVSGVSKKPIKHLSTGYFLFTNLPEGIYTITAEGDFYQQVELEVDTSSLDPNLPVVDIFLEPNESYPFPEE